MEEIMAASVEQRLGLLEDRYRRLARRNTALVLGVVALASLAATSPPSSQQAPSPSQQSPRQASQQSPSPGKKGAGDDAGPMPEQKGRVLEAEAFLLRDSQQRVRGRLAMEGDRAVLALYNADGTARLTLTQLEDGAEVALLASAEGQGVRLRADGNPEGSRVEVAGKAATTATTASGVSIVDADDGQRLVMKLINGNFPLLGVSQHGQAGPPSVEITAGDDGSRKIALHTATGEAVIAMTSSDQQGALALRQPGREHTLQLQSGNEAAGGPSIVCLAPEGQDGGGVLPRLSLGLRREGEPFLQLNDATGRPQAVLPQPVSASPAAEPPVAPEP